MEGIERFNENIWVLKTLGAVITFDGSGGMPNADGGKKATVSWTVGATTKSADIWSWGSKNNLPQEREDLVKENNIIPELLATKRDIVLGTGIVCYRTKFVEGEEVKEFVETPKDIQAFFDRINIRKYLRTSCKALILHANVFTEVVATLGDKVDTIRASEPRHVRLGKKGDDGKIKNAYLCGKWHKIKDTDAVVTEVPMYDEDAKSQAKYLLHTGDDLLTDDYYFSPRWWGGKDWIMLANRIPRFHLRNLDNGYLIRYHIEIPKDYFRDYTASQQTEGDNKTAKTREDEARKKFISKLNQFLAGENGAGRAVVTEYEINKAMGKDFPGIKITPMVVDMKDEALLKLFGASNDANISGQGIPPALAAIQVPGKLGSGSDTRNSLIAFTGIKTPAAREILLEPLYLVARKNGWDPAIKFGFKDIEITKLDDNPTGQQQALIAQ